MRPMSVYPIQPGRYTVNNGVEYVGLYAVASMSVDPAFSTVYGSGTFLANTYAGGTHISTNKGATWAPCTMAGSSTPILIVLDALSLQGRPAWSTPKSVVTAPGLIVSNAVASTSRSGMTPTVYISRDGGLTWSNARPDQVTGDDDAAMSAPVPYLYDILDHGSVIVLVETTSRTSVVSYSLDEGDSWSQFPFYNATTMMGRWAVGWGTSGTRGYTFDCYPAYVGNRPNAGTPGFVLFCSAKSWSNAVAVGQNFTVDVLADPTGFSGSADGVSSGHSAVVSSVTGPLAAMFPLSTPVTFTNGMLVFGTVTTMSRPGRDPTHPNSHHIRFLATITNFRASSTGIFAYFLSQTPAGNAIVGIRFDFGPILARACSAAAYEDYRMIGTNNTCYLGQNALLKRRKQCSICRQTSAVAAMSVDASWMNWSPCDCRGQDYSCVYGYRRNSNVLGSASASSAEACTRDSVTGVAASPIWYRKVPGDVCRGTFAHAAVVPAPPSSPSSGGAAAGSGAIIAVAIVILIVVVAGGLVAYKKGKCGGATLGQRYLEIRADDTLARAEGHEDKDSEDEDGDDDMIEA